MKVAGQIKYCAAGEIVQRYLFIVLRFAAHRRAAGALSGARMCRYNGCGVTHTLAAGEKRISLTM